MENLLEVRDLKTYFYTQDGVVKSVDGVSFSVRRGETFGLVGESGCGKSQTCRSVLRLIKKPGKIVGGQVLYRGRDLVKMKARELRKIRGKEISIIFQEPMTSLNPVLKIRKQIYESFEGLNLSKQEKNDRAVELLKLVGIPMPETRLDEYIHQFSGGMRQRAMIAIALGSNPKLLIADEPTTALDVTIQDQIMKLLNRLKQELDMSVILVTHDLGVVAQMCDRVAVMYAGMVMEMTDTVTLFAKPRHPYTYALMSSLPDQSKRGSRLEPILGSPPDLGNLPQGCPFAPRCKFCRDICKKELPPLVEVEPGHMSRCHLKKDETNFSGIISVPEAKGEKILK